MNWNLYSFIVRGKYRKKIIVALNIERTPTQISGITKINISHVSRTLSEFVANGVVKCLNPKDHSGKIYQLRKEGVEIRNHLIKSDLW